MNENKCQTTLTLTPSVWTIKNSLMDDGCSGLYDIRFSVLTSQMILISKASVTVQVKIWYTDIHWSRRIPKFKLKLTRPQERRKDKTIAGLVIFPYVPYKI